MAKDSTGLLIGLAVAGAAAYWAYTQGWFSSLFGSSSVAPAVPVSMTPVTTVAITAPAAPAPSAPVAAPAPSAPSNTIAPSGATAMSSALIVNALSQAASNPGNIALSTNGGQTYSGYQWDAIAKSALGSNYIPLAQLSGISGGSQYTLAQYGQAVVNAVQSGVSGLGRVRAVIHMPGRVIVLPRNYRWRRGVA